VTLGHDSTLSNATTFAGMQKTPATIGHYITSKAIGCRGKTMRVGNSSKKCIHIGQSKLPQSFLKILQGKIKKDQGNNQGRQLFLL
jgi:hypothetical protein